jgi:cytochrome c biogenesis protein CcmG/thiol:disulfide interchange protein DsbE
MPAVKNPIRWAALGVGLVVVLFTTLVLGSRLGEDASANRSAVLGKPLSAWELQTVDGATVGSADLAGKPYVINVWASWCPPCRKEHGALRAFHERYRRKGVELIGVLYKDTPKDAKAYMKELGGDWVIADDPKYKLINDLGVSGPPETFVVGPDGIVTVKFTGAVSLADLEGALAAIGVS